MPTTAWGKMPMHVGTVLSIGILQQTWDYCGNGYLTPSCMGDMGMRIILLQIFIESLASMHDIIPVIYGRCLETWRYVLWGKMPTDVWPYVLLLPYLTTNCSVYFKIDTFTDNDHKGYVHAALLPCLVPYWWLTPSIYVFTSVFIHRSVPDRCVFPFC